MNRASSESGSQLWRIQLRGGRDNKKAAYAQSGNSILEKFLVCNTARKVAHMCTETFLGHLPPSAKLVLLHGNEQDYIAGCWKLFERLCPLSSTRNYFLKTRHKTCLKSSHKTRKNSTETDREQLG